LFQSVPVLRVVRASNFCLHACGCQTQFSWCRTHRLWTHWCTCRVFARSVVWLCARSNIHIRDSRCSLAGVAWCGLSLGRRCALPVMLGLTRPLPESFGFALPRDPQCLRNSSHRRTCASGMYVHHRPVTHSPRDCSPTLFPSVFCVFFPFKFYSFLQTRPSSCGNSPERKAATADQRRH
jgi:hypothetical protein